MRKLLGLALIALTLFTAVPAQDVQRIRRRVAAGGGSSTLDTGLVAFWALEEATGTTRNDSFSTNHLTSTGANSLQVTGKIGFGFSPQNDHVEINDNAPLSITGSMSIAGWVNFSSLAGAGSYPGFISKADSGSTISYLLFANGDNGGKLEWAVSSDGATSGIGGVASTTALSTSTWYFVFVYFDDTGNELGISVNNGAVQTAAFTGNIFDSTSKLTVGHMLWFGTFMSNGSLDAIGIWSRKLTSTEVSCLYNSGNGREYPTWPCP